MDKNESSGKEHILAMFGFDASPISTLCCILGIFQHLFHSQIVMVMKPFFEFKLSPGDSMDRPILFS